jgi:hypothetical protein
MDVHNNIGVINIKDLSVQEAAKKYIDIGWKLVPVPPGTKGPNSFGWNLPENLIKTHSDCDSIREGWNIGVHLEESGIVVLDIDSVLYTKFTFDYFGLDYDTILAGAPRTIGEVGHDKAFFKAPSVKLGLHKFNWPERSKDEKPITVLELRAGAIQDILPPSIHKDTLKPYLWKIDPFRELPDLPKEILALWLEWDKFLPELKNLCPWDKVEHTAPPKKPRKTQKQDNGVIQRYNDKHHITELLREHGYIQKTADRWLSPFSTTGLAGVMVFPDGRAFTHHGSDPWVSQHSLDSFDFNTQMKYNGNMNAALDDARDEFNIPNSACLVSEGKAIAETFLKNKTIPKQEVPEYLLAIPGILQEVVEYYNTTAKKPQPQYAVSAALTLGSVIMGRRFVTDQNNYTSLYIANLGKTSVGKEHPIDVIEEILKTAGIDKDIVGPPGYHSAGALFTALENQPCHLAIIDELGLHFQSNNLSGSSNKLDAQRAVMEAFGRLGGTMRPMGYSKQTLTAEQKARVEQKAIERPAITILGMSTPNTIYDNINVESISSGFIPRFIFIETIIGRQKMRRLGKKPVISGKLIEWVRNCFSAHAGNGNLSDVCGPQMPPDPVVIPFEPEALDVLEEYEDRIMKRQNALDKHGMSGLLGKTVEIAHRVALIVAVSQNHSCVYEEDTKWAVDFIDYYSVQTERNMKGRIHGSDFQAVVNEVGEFVKEQGIKGATEYEIQKACRRYSALDKRARDSVFQVLPGDHDIQFVNFPPGPKGGAPRRAYVGIDILKENGFTFSDS